MRKKRGPQDGGADILVSPTPYVYLSAIRPVEQQ